VVYGAAGMPVLSVRAGRILQCGGSRTPVLVECWTTSFNFVVKPKEMEEKLP
jgi:hypothetical protein